MEAFVDRATFAQELDGLASRLQDAWNRRNPDELALQYAKDAIVFIGDWRAIGRNQIRTYYKILCLNPHNMGFMQVLGLTAELVAIDDDGTMRVELGLQADYLRSNLTALDTIETHFILSRNIRKEGGKFCIEREMEFEPSM